MDAFESLIGSLLEREGYWVRSSYKVNLTKEDKHAIGRPSCPRWEIDLVAYKAATNDLRIVECKSYLDSFGVQYKSFLAETAEGRFKLFTDATLFQVVSSRLTEELVSSGACLPDPIVTLCLAAGKIRNATDRNSLRHHFSNSGWLLLDSEWIVNALLNAANGSYEDDAALVAVKILLRREDA